MSSVGLSGLSNISTDTLQTRYEKALKQINKLIDINRQLKETSSQSQAQIQSLTMQVQSLTKENQELDHENNILQSKYMELEGHYNELELYCKKLEDELENHQDINAHFNDQLREQELNFNHTLQSEIQKCSALARENQYIHQGYEESVKAIETQNVEKESLEKQVKELRTAKQLLQAENTKLTQMVTQQYIQDLQNKLTQAESSIQSLIKECQSLKSQQIDQEVNAEKQRFEKYINLTSTPNSEAGDFKELIQQYKKKIRQLQVDKKNADQKYRNLKSKIAKSPAKDANKKIESLERLTEKQQRQFAKMIETYDHELNAVHKEHLKIREAYFTLMQKYTKKGEEIIEKDKIVNSLKYSLDKTNFQLSSIKQVHFNLFEEKENKLKSLSDKTKIAHVQSITMPQESAKDAGVSENVKLKYSTVQKGLPSAHSMFMHQPSITIETGKEATKHKIPVTVRYSNPSSEQGNFKFIQSVNIINGYNVSMGDNTGRSHN